MQAIVMHDANAAKHCQQFLHLGDRRKVFAPFLFSFIGSSPLVTWKDIPCHLVYHGRQASCKPPEWATAIRCRTSSLVLCVNAIMIEAVLATWDIRSENRWKIVEEVQHCVTRVNEQLSISSCLKPLVS